MHRKKLGIELHEPPRLIEEQREDLPELNLQLPHHGRERIGFARREFPQAHREALGGGGTPGAESAALDHRSGQGHYLARLQLLMDTVFDEAELLAEIDRMEALIAPVTGDISSEINVVRAWVNANRASEQAEIDSPPAGFGGHPNDFCFF